MPGDPEIIASKVVNALIVDAVPSEGVMAVTNKQLLGAADSEVDFLKRQMGGLWVGGNLELRPDRLTFVPNRLNKILHEGQLNFEIPFNQVIRIGWRRGLVTSIVEVVHNHGQASFRCYGSKALVRLIETAIDGSRALS